MATHASDDRLAEARRRLRRFADTEAAGVSPLYEHLARHAADDDEVAGLLAAAPPDAGAPLLLAAAQRALHANPFHELVNYYPSMGGSYGVDAATWPLFRGFVLDHADAIRRMVAERRAHTDEVRRAALLYPAVAAVAKGAKGPVALLEVGCGAGLLLGMDRYGYRYQAGQAGQVAVGPAKAPVGLHCALQLAPGAALPAVPKKLAVGARLGLGPGPVDVTDEDAVAWLEACVWADQPERQRLLTTAVGLLRKDPPELVEGDVVADLPAAADRLPAELPLVVLTSDAMRPMSGDRRAGFAAALAELAARRPLWWVAHEAHGTHPSVVPSSGGTSGAERDVPTYGVLALTSWENGEPETRVLGHASLHGERLIWLP